LRGPGFSLRPGWGGSCLEPALPQGDESTSPPRGQGVPGDPKKSGPKKEGAVSVIAECVGVIPNENVAFSISMKRGPIGRDFLIKCIGNTTHDYLRMVPGTMRSEGGDVWRRRRLGSPETPGQEAEDRVIIPEGVLGDDDVDGKRQPVGAPRKMPND